MDKIASFSKGSGYSKGDLQYEGDPAILYGRLYTNYETIIKDVNTFVIRKEKSVLSEGGEVIVPASGESSEDIARASVVAQKGVILAGDLNIIKVNSLVDSVFLALTISHGKVKKELAKRAQGKSVVHLHNSDLKEVDVVFTTVHEQTKIGQFFKTLDDTIALHQRKLSNLKMYKNSLLSKMFPVNGESVPELRFAGFTKDWVQGKLGEAAKITMGQSPLGSTYTDNPNDYILVQGNADMKNGKVTPRVWTTQITKTADEGDIIFSVRAPVGDVGKTDYNIVIGRGVAAVKGNDFIFQTLIKMKASGNWNQLSTGSTFESINSADLKEASINLPTPEEQAKIGQFFKTLDDTIATSQKKIELLSTLKKEYLNRMFEI